MMGWYPSEVVDFTIFKFESEFQENLEMGSPRKHLIKFIRKIRNKY